MTEDGPRIEGMSAVYRLKFMNVSLIDSINKCTPTCADIQGEDSYVYLALKVEANKFIARTSDANNTFKVRTFFLCISEYDKHKQSEEMAHNSPISPTGRVLSSAPSHKARTELLSSLCQNILPLNVRNLRFSSL